MILAVSFIGFVLVGGLVWWISVDEDVALLGGLLVPAIVDSWHRRRARSGPPPEGLARLSRKFGRIDWPVTYASHAPPAAALRSDEELAITPDG